MNTMQEKSNPENKAKASGENEYDPEKFFDEENYSTLVIKASDEKPKGKVKLDDLVELLTSDNKQEKEQALALLKNQKAIDFLMHAIFESENKDQQALLVAACWECGLDFSMYFDEFVNLACDGDLLTALEASTVITEMTEPIDVSKLKLAIKKIQVQIELKNEKQILLSDLKLNLIERSVSK